MKPITFIDTEIDPKSKKILDIGSVKSDGSIFHSNSINDFSDFLNNDDFICGHNIIRHDLKYIQKFLSPRGKNNLKYIDTLFLSPLLFPTKPYHHLLKDDKIQTDELNNPVNDCQKAKDLFYDEISAFGNLDESLKKLYYLLLKEHDGFLYFFEYISFTYSEDALLTKLINEQFQNKFCSNAPIGTFIDKHPIELAYCLALINSTDRYSITPKWVLMNYPEVERIMYLLRNKPCLVGCKYCDEALDAKLGLKDLVLPRMLWNY
tara:strand:+ start:1584 stop:2372 length:789 start_codon:yes stop_codon:yes gene_type:complete